MKALAFSGGVFLVLAMAFGAGCEWQGARLGKVIATMKADSLAAALQGEQDARAIELAMAQASVAVEEADQLRKLKRKTVERIVTHDVIKYIQAGGAADVQCLDAAGVRIHNTSAASDLSTDPQPTTQHDGTTGGSSAADLILVVTDNYATCHRWADRLTGLQAWVNDVLIKKEKEK